MTSSQLDPTDKSVTGGQLPPTMLSAPSPIRAISIEDLQDHEVNPKPVPNNENPQYSTRSDYIASSESGDDGNEKDTLTHHPVRSTMPQKRPAAPTTVARATSVLSLESIPTDVDNPPTSSSTRLSPLLQGSVKRPGLPADDSATVKKRQRSAEPRQNHLQSQPTVESLTSNNSNNFSTGNPTPMIIDLHGPNEEPGARAVRLQNSLPAHLSGYRPPSQPVFRIIDTHEESIDGSVEFVDVRTVPSPAPSPLPIHPNEVLINYSEMAAGMDHIQVTNPDLVNYSNDYKLGDPQWDRFIFSRHHPQRFDFVNNTHLSTLSPYAAATSAMKDVAPTAVCAVCGHGETCRSCVRCLLRFHKRCINPFGWTAETQKWMCIACSSAKVNDTSVTWAIENPPPSLPRPSTGLKRLTVDAREGNPVDYVLNPALLNMYIAQVGTDWLQCVKCDTIRIVGLGVLSESAHSPFECRDAYWCPVGKRTCVHPSKRAEVEGEEGAKVRKYLTMRSRRRSALMYQMGEDNREEFGFRPVIDDAEPGGNDAMNTKQLDCSRSSPKPDNLNPVGKDANGNGERRGGTVDVDVAAAEGKTAQEQISVEIDLLNEVEEVVTHVNHANKPPRMQVDVAGSNSKLSLHPIVTISEEVSPPKSSALKRGPNNVGGRGAVSKVGSTGGAFEIVDKPKKKLVLSDDDDDLDFSFSAPVDPRKECEQASRCNDVKSSGLKTAQLETFVQNKPLETLQYRIRTPSSDTADNEVGGKHVQQASFVSDTAHGQHKPACEKSVGHASKENDLTESARHRRCGPACKDDKATLAQLSQYIESLGLDERDTAGLMSLAMRNDHSIHTLFAIFGNEPSKRNDFVCQAMKFLHPKNNGPTVNRSSTGLEKRHSSTLPTVKTKAVTQTKASLPPSTGLLGLPVIAPDDPERKAKILEGFKKLRFRHMLKNANVYDRAASAIENASGTTIFVTDREIEDRVQDLYEKHRHEVREFLRLHNISSADLEQMQLEKRSEQH